MKTLLAVACLMLASSSSIAQSVEAGVKGGMNWANQTVSGTSTTGIQSFHAGFYFFSRVSGILYLQEELSYSGQGFDFRFNGSPINVRLDYVSVPILARFNVSRLFHVEAGPQINILVASEVKTSTQTLNNLFTYTAANLALAVGGGINLPANLGLTVRYFSDITDADSLQNVESKNNVFQVSFTYSFVKRGD